jgi:hypothetical protein
VIVAKNIKIVDKADSRFKILVKEMLRTSSTHTMQQHMYKNNKKSIFMLDNGNWYYQNIAKNSLTK